MVALNKLLIHNVWKRIELISDLDFVLELHYIIKGTFALEYNESLEGVICVLKKRKYNKDITEYINTEKTVTTY